jgi:hypothetical protein
LGENESDFELYRKNCALAACQELGGFFHLTAAFCSTTQMSLVAAWVV